MQQPERRPPGYVQRVLSDGARAPRARASAWQLLGRPAIAGESPLVERIPGPPLQAFAYAHPFVASIDTAAASIDTAPALADDLGHPAAVPLPQPFLEAPIAGPRATVRMPDAAMPSIEVTASDPPVAHTRRATFVAPFPAPDARAPARAAAPAAKATPTKTAAPVRPAAQASALAPAIKRFQGPAPADAPVDPQRLPPAMRALLPMLGRICRADADAVASPEGATPTQPQTAIGVPARWSTDAVSEPTAAPFVSLPAAPFVLGRGETPASRRLWKPEARAGAAPRPAASPLPSARVTMPHAPPVASPLPRAPQLRKMVQTLVAKALDAQRSASGARPPTEQAPARRPPQTIEHIVTTRTIYQPRSPRAFCERRYLGRPHMRAFR